MAHQEAARGIMQKGDNKDQQKKKSSSTGESLRGGPRAVAIGRKRKWDDDIKEAMDDMVACQAIEEEAEDILWLSSSDEDEFVLVPRPSYRRSTTVADTANDTSTTAAAAASAAAAPRPYAAALAQRRRKQLQPLKLLPKNYDHFPGGFSKQLQEKLQPRQFPPYRRHGAVDEERRTNTGFAGAAASSSIEDSEVSPLPAYDPTSDAVCTTTTTSSSASTAVVDMMDMVD